jgi:hypothetical protein
MCSSGHSKTPFASQICASRVAPSLRDKNSTAFHTGNFNNVYDRISARNPSPLNHRGEMCPPTPSPTASIEYFESLEERAAHLPRNSNSFGTRCSLNGMDILGKAIEPRSQEVGNSSNRNYRRNATNGEHY